MLIWKNLERESTNSGVTVDVSARFCVESLSPMMVGKPGSWRTVMIQNNTQFSTLHISDQHSKEQSTAPSTQPR